MKLKKLRHLMNQIMTEMRTEIQEYSQTASALADLAHRYRGVIFDVSTRDGMQVAVKSRAELRGYRTSLEKTRVLIKEPAFRRTQLIDSEARRITSALLELEDPIDRQIKAEETRKEDSRLAAERAEKARIEAAERAEKEAEQARLAAERAELERMRDELQRAARAQEESDRHARMKIEEAERAARMKIEEEEKIFRLAIEESRRKAREEFEEEEAKARAIRLEAERRLRAEQMRVDSERKIIEEAARKQREAEEAKQRAIRDAEQIKQREESRLHFELVEGWRMLENFVSKYRTREEFIAVCAAIIEHLRRE